MADLFEIAWPVRLKIAQHPNTRWQGISIAVVAIFLSGWTMWLAQKDIPMGTVYAVWTGLGAAGAFFIGIIFYDEPSTLLRYLGVLLIVSGVIIIKFAS